MSDYIEDYIQDQLPYDWDSEEAQGTKEELANTAYGARATKKELKAKIASLEAHIGRLQRNASALRTAALVQRALGLKQGRRQVLDEIFGDCAPGPDVTEALKLHLNSTYGMVAQERNA